VIYTIVGATEFHEGRTRARRFREARIPHALVHTGQHYDETMSKVFFEDLGMPRSIIDLGVGSGTHAGQQEP
jgi:UDP-N-acetylglucosamine 2-epimerase